MARDMVHQGEHSAGVIRSSVTPLFQGIQVEYFSLVDLETLQPVERIEGPVLIAAGRDLAWLDPAN